MKKFKFRMLQAIYLITTAMEVLFESIAFIFDKFAYPFDKLSDILLGKISVLAKELDEIKEKNKNN